MPSPRFIHCPPADPLAPAAEAAAGLLAHPARLSPKFFYDALGARLFDAITLLPEYTPTRSEAALMARHGEAIAAAVRGRLGTDITLVDLGAGDGAKAARLFQPLRVARYVAVDIAAAHLQPALHALQQQHPQVQMLGVGMDFSAALALPPGAVEGPALLFYPGSSIGNFDPDDALRLLRQARTAAAGGALLIGVDRVKPVPLMLDAYDDALGLTAAFNRNLLRHVNRLLGSNFDLRGWQHLALWNNAASRIEMHLQARHDQQVRWPGGERTFAAGERIHTENSTKWQPGDFQALLHDAGLRQVQHWSDDQDLFSVFLASA